MNKFVVFCFRHYFIMRCSPSTKHLGGLSFLKLLTSSINTASPSKYHGILGYSLMITGIADLSPFLIVSEMKRNY